MPGLLMVIDQPPNPCPNRGDGSLATHDTGR
jgi:hypothetical protein